MQHRVAQQNAAGDNLQDEKKTTNKDKQKHLCIPALPFQGECKQQRQKAQELR